MKEICKQFSHAPPTNAQYSDSAAILSHHWRKDTLDNTMRLFKATNNHILKGWVPTEMNMTVPYNESSVSKEKKAVLSGKRTLSTES